MVALAAPCPKMVTPSRKYLLKRLLGGLHPRSGEYLGEVVHLGKDRGETAQEQASFRPKTSRRSVASTSGG